MFKDQVVSLAVSDYGPGMGALLVYGPPGTGKTHTVRYLLGQSGGTTAVLPAGGSLARITEAAKLARALAQRP
ncbi:AAA family ATPase [Arthrobacter sp. STN4]|nr:AAA family ATPase [Arthrobacter sp. STN4]